MKKKTVTIEDIAKEADVSAATVSHVINKTRFVNDNTAKRVNEIIKKRGYLRNSSQKKLVQRGWSSKLIGLIVNDSYNPLFAFISREIELLADKIGYSVIMCNTNRNTDNEIRYINTLIARKVDGVIIVATQEKKENFNNLLRYKIPFVLIERKIKDLETDAVMGDRYNAAIKAVDYLAKLGHERIAFINSDSHLYNSQLRMQGFIKGLKKNNLDFKQDLILENGGYWPKDGYVQAQKIFNMIERPTAIIAHNDLLAMGIIRAIQDRNLNVPNDFSVLGFDNLFIDDYFHPRITSITYRKKDIANNCLSILIKRIEGDKGKPEEIMLDLQLVIRESTGPCKAESRFFS